MMKLEDNISSRRNANQKSKKKKEQENPLATNLSKPVLGLPPNKKINLTHETRQRLVDKLNTDRSTKKKSVSKDYSKSNINYDLFKSVKGSDNALKKKIKKIVQNNRHESDTKSSRKNGLSLEQGNIHNIGDIPGSSAFFLKSKHYQTLDTKSKGSHEFRGSAQKSGKSTSKNKDGQNKILMSFQGRSLANISSNLSTDRNAQHFMYAKKHSNKEFGRPGAPLLFNNATGYGYGEPKVMREQRDNKEQKVKSRKFDSLVKRLIENSNVQNSKSNRICHTDRYPYFNESESNKMYLKGLFTPLMKNK